VSRFYDIAAKLFPSRCREIPAIDGGILLRQIKLTEKVFLQNFAKPEPEGIFHLHRWERMRSFVLTGSFIEQRLRADRSKRLIRHRFLSTYSMTRDVVHRVAYWSPRCWTIFIMMGNTGEWGYLDENFTFTKWDEYIPEELVMKKRFSQTTLGETNG